MTEWTIGTDGKTHIELEMTGSKLTFAEARRLRDQLNDALVYFKHAKPQRKRGRHPVFSSAQEIAAHNIIMRAAAALQEARCK